MFNKAQFTKKVFWYDHCLICGNLNIQITVQVQKVELDVAHQCYFLEHWGMLT
jgi:hypothetical protein